MSLYKRKIRHKDGSYSESWYYDFRWHGVRYFDTIGPCARISRTEARAVERAKMVEAAQGIWQKLRPAAAPSLAALKDRYFSEMWPHWRPGTLKRYDDAWKVLGPAVGPDPADTLTRERLQRYRDARLQTVGAHTVNTEMALVRGIILFAVEEDLLPFIPYKRLRRVRPDRKDRPVLTGEEETRLLAECPEKLRPVVLMGLYTGLRRGELTRLRWPDVDLHRRVVQVRAETAKTHRPRAVPLCDRLVDVLAGLPRRIGDDRVFGYALFDRVFFRAKHRAGLGHVRFHDLRHTFTSRLQGAGVDLATIQAFLGHTSLEMTWHYTHAIPGHARTAIAVFDRDSQRFDQPLPVGGYNV